jgi:hypothetical protein
MLFPNERVRRDREQIVRVIRAKWPQFNEHAFHRDPLMNFLNSKTDAKCTVWISWIGLAIAGYLAYEGFRSSRS